MFQKPQQYMQRARSFLTTAVHRGRHLASAMDGAVQSGLAMYGAARPILAEAAQRYASPGQQAALQTFGKGVDQAASHYGRLRGGGRACQRPVGAPLWRNWWLLRKSDHGC